MWRYFDPVHRTCGFQVTQSGAKKARKDTVKVTNKKKDPAALAKLEEGDQAMKDGKFALAKVLHSSCCCRAL